MSKVAALAVRTATPVFPSVPSFIQPVAHYTVTYNVGSMAPLTTVWTEPASCVTEAPTMIAGTCNTASCSAFAVSALTDLLWTYGLTVNYPGFTTAQQLTSTNCMPSRYAPLQSMYFTGGIQCPLSWTTATVDSDTYYSSKTIVCCPINYIATSITGNAGYDCYQNATLTVGQKIVLAAEGQIATARPATVPSTVGWVPSWTSLSIISTTAWPTATVADLYHPAVNFLVTGSAAAPTSSGTSGSSSSSSSPSFSLFQLAFGTSIGVVVAIAIGCLIALACFYALIRRLICGPSPRRRPQPQPQPQPQSVIYYAPQGGPPPMQYVQGQYPPPGPYPPPGQYGPEK